MSVSDSKITRSAAIRADGERARLVKRLAEEFKVDPGGLRDVIDAAAEIYKHAEFDAQQGRKREAKQLKKLDKQLPQTLELLRELRLPILLAASRSVYGETALVHENYGKVASAYTDLLDQLEEICDVARGLPKRGRNQGEHGGRDVDGQPVDYGPLRELMEVLRDYWSGALKRKFRQRHKKDEAWDGAVPTRKAGEAVRFCYAVVEHIAPGQGACLKSIARGYTDAAIATAAIKEAERRAAVRDEPAYRK